MLRWLLRGFLISFAAALGLLAYCSTQKPTTNAAEDDRQVAQVIITGFGKFDDRNTVNHTGKGKILYWPPRGVYLPPRVGGHPILKLYEVTSPDEIAEIESLSRRALQELPWIKTVELRFHERQNWVFHDNGSRSRGSETPFRTVTISRPADH